MRCHSKEGYSQRHTIAYVEKDVKRFQHSYLPSGNINATAAWKTIWQVLKKLSTELPWAPAIPLPGICPGEIKTYAQQKPVRKFSQQRYP